MFLPDEYSQSMLYMQPESLQTNFQREKIPGSPMPQCPATRNIFDNVFVVKSAIDDEFSLPNLPFDYEQQSLEIGKMQTQSRVGMTHHRPTSIPNHINAMYDLGWILFASEPVKARFTAPWFPASSPIHNARLSPGEFDIGRWYRPFNLDFHIPFESRMFSVKKGDPLFYVELMTDKKVEFKRYMLSDRLAALMQETARSPQLYGQHKKLEERYSQFESTLMPEMVLAEIKKNLIE
jgi:hypothetical protein